MTLTPPEYCVLIWVAVVAILLAGFRLPFRFSAREFAESIYVVIILLGLELSLIPTVVLFARSVVQHVRALATLGEGESFVRVVREGLRKEWGAVAQGLRIFRDWLPMFVFLATYWAFGSLASRVNTVTRDALLEKWDLKLFGSNYSVLAQRFYTPTLTDFMVFCYFMHVLLIPIVLTLFYYKGEIALFRRTLMFLVLAGIMGGVGYVLVPAYGPYLYLHNLYAASPVHDPYVLIDVVSAPLDTFPSLHVIISAGLLLYARRYAKWLFWVLLPFVVGNWLSTIYLRYHYTVDVVAGFVLTGVAMGITEASFRVWRHGGRCAERSG